MISQVIVAYHLPLFSWVSFSAYVQGVKVFNRNQELRAGTSRSDGYSSHSAAGCPCCAYLV